MYYKLKESSKKERTSIQGIVLFKNEWISTKEKMKLKNLEHLVDSFDGDNPPLIKEIEKPKPKKKKKVTKDETNLEEELNLKKEGQKENAKFNN